MESKWNRNDVLCEVEKFYGMPRKEFREMNFSGVKAHKIEATQAFADEMENRMIRLINGDENALDLDEVRFENRRDGVSGKIRKIAYCCVFHQFFNHLAKLGLEPLFKAKILPQQFASIPKKGQTHLKDYLVKVLRKKKHAIKYAQKTDIRNAYGSLRYSDIIAIVEKLIPSAVWLILLLKALAKKSPDGFLIIGGYLDAWLFNFAMSFVLRYLCTIIKERRGERRRLIRRLTSYMDDFGLLASRLADIGVCIKKLIAYIKQKFRLELKLGKLTTFLSIKEEKARKHAKRPSQRGTPSLDMGGYRVHSSYVTIRKTIFLRLRRCYMRAKAREEALGYLPIQTARGLISYKGYFKNSNSKYAAEKYEVVRLHNAAREAISFHDKAKAKQQKEHKKC